MRRARCVMAGVLLLAQAAGAPACGFCIEDKVAAAYDHAVVKRAVERGHEIVFVEIAGPVPLKPAQWRTLIKLTENIPGVERGSVRTAVHPQVMSFDLDAARLRAAAVVMQLHEKARALQVSVDLVKVLNERQGVASR